jgi:hypothetical protein
MIHASQLSSWFPFQDSITHHACETFRALRVARGHSFRLLSVTKDMVALTDAQTAAVLSFMSSKRGTRKLIEHPPEDWPAQWECGGARSAQNLACRAPAHTLCCCIARVVT